MILGIIYSILIFYTAFFFDHYKISSMCSRLSHDLGGLDINAGFDFTVEKLLR